MKKPQKVQKKRTGHIVSHTHWDREWRYPIWETRLMLLDFMDELVKVLETEKYPAFLLDGQVAPVVDYLEMRPEMTDRVKALIKNGKLHVGPWFCLPDEYPVDGEALVRNLLWGNRKCRELGKVLKIGYTPFGWGQTAQLPQLYAGFGMDVAMIGKRVSNKRAPKCEFLWRGPDGTELLATRFGEAGRQNFYFWVHLSSLFGTEHLGKDWYYDWSKGGVAYHRADREQMEQDHFRVDAPAKWFPEQMDSYMLEGAWNTCRDTLITDDRLMMNGCDYTASQPMFPQMLGKLNELDAETDRQWVHTTMPKYVDLMRKKLDRKKLPVVEGELRDGPAMAVTGNALTTRLYLKRLNKYAQNLLIRFAEPLSILAKAAGAPYPQAFVEKAWDFLLQSHPHDSINGVTQDKTVLDVMNRLHQVVDLSQTIANRSMQELVRRIDTSNFADRDVLLTVFNPLPYPRREVLEAFVDMPDPSGSLLVQDANGKAVPTQWQGQEPVTYCVAEVHTRAFPYRCHRHLLNFDTGEVPAGGYKIFKVVPTSEYDKKETEWGDRHSRTSTLLKSPTVIENESLRVSMCCNGTFNLTDRKSGVTYKGLNYYEDRGEAGDYWNNLHPMYDQIHSSVGCSARIWAEESGPLKATLVSEIVMRIPKRLIPEQQKRSDELEDLKIRTAVTLRAGESHVEVKVDFDNQSESHYLRAMFPTGIKGAQYADAGGHFIVDHRAIRPVGPSDGLVWPDMGTLPQNNFVDVSDGKSGVAFLNDSLTEYEVLDNEERTVALSLLRAIKDWVCTEHRCGSDFPSQKGGQAFGSHSMRYAIFPHEGNWEKANVPLAAERFNVPLRPIQTRSNPGELPKREASLYRIDNPEIRFSALKKTADRNTVTLRVYNPTAKRQTAKIEMAPGVKQAWLTNLNEDRAHELKVTKDAVTISADPNKIVTVEMLLQK